MADQGGWILAVLIGWRPSFSNVWVASCAVVLGLLYSLAASRETIDVSMVSATPIFLFTPTFLVGIAIYGMRKGWGYVILLLVSLLLAAVPAAKLITGVNLLRYPANISFRGLVGICSFYAIVASIIAL